MERSKPSHLAGLVFFFDQVKLNQLLERFICQSALQRGLFCQRSSRGFARLKQNIVENGLIFV